MKKVKKILLIENILGVKIFAPGSKFFSPPQKNLPLGAIFLRLLLLLLLLVGAAPPLGAAFPGLPSCLPPKGGREGGNKNVSLRFL